MVAMWERRTWKTAFGVGVLAKVVECSVGWNLDKSAPSTTTNSISEAIAVVGGNTGRGRSEVKTESQS